MAVHDESEIARSEERPAQQLARALIAEVWDLGAAPMLLDVEDEGADWEASVRIKHTEESTAARGERNSRP